MSAKTLMIMGSMSSAGKSLLTAGLCRVFTRKGLRVLPFKAQNMSNNAAVCPDGGEIGRAQAVQAAAAGVVPTVEMNPVLLKPEADHKSQLVLLGEAVGSFSGSEYYAKRAMVWEPITHSLDHLREQADLVLIEGAGSIAELNLSKSDVTNLAVARYAAAPCLLAGDIDRGGIFAQLAGSWWLLDERDKKYLKGFIVNKFRGEIALFQDGITILCERSGGVPVVGVVPYLVDHGIPDEDAASFSGGGHKSPAARKICVVRLPHISNFDDFDPLKYDPMIELCFVKRPDELNDAVAILLPGTKNTIADMEWLMESGMAEAIRQLHQAGTPVAGICGGYQLMGQRILNPERVESTVEACDGLGILPVETFMSGQKNVTRSRMRVISDQGFLAGLPGQTLTGYEIHQGVTVSPSPLFEILPQESGRSGGHDGTLVADGVSFGTYLHGIFDNDTLRTAWLHALGVQSSEINFRAMVAQRFDKLADHLEAHLDMALIEQIIETGVG